MVHSEAEHNRPLDCAEGRLLHLFADLLDYPTAALAEKAHQCEDLVSSTVPKAAPLVRAFRIFAQETPAGHLEEVYTGFFDLNPVCHPYVGYQLFGESYKRSEFLLALKELYRGHGFEISDAELPDRVSVLLRFLSQCSDDVLVSETAVEGVLPALARMTKSNAKRPKPSLAEMDSDAQLEGHSQGEVLTGGFVLALTEENEGADPLKVDQHPYYQALRALQMVLEQLHSTQTQEQSGGSPGGMRLPKGERNHVR